VTVINALVALNRLKDFLLSSEVKEQDSAYITEGVLLTLLLGSLTECSSLSFLAFLTLLC
jgi:hypothetical protein